MATMPTYARAPLSFERGEGAYLFGDDGRRYLDFAAGIAVDSLGHAHPHLVAALTKQAQSLWHVSNLFEIPQQANYAERLVAATFADAAFFCNSGAEAIECALKIARRYHAEQGAPERYRTVTVQGAFHGRTLATIAAGGNPKYTEGFGPAVDGFDQVAFGNLNELRAAIGGQTAAIMIEPVQGEGGIRAMDADYLRGLRQAADDFGILLIYDEIQTGFGRTGKLFAHEWSGVTPDIMAVAKGIAGGFPCGACLATDRVSSAMSPGIHGTTFGGNPLAMAVAGATLDILLADGFLANVVAMSARLKEGFLELAKTHDQIIDDVRGMGLMLGMRVAEGRSNADFTGRLRDQGLLCVPAGENVVRFVPPLIIGPTEVDLAVEMIGAACTSWASES